MKSLHICLFAATALTALAAGPALADYKVGDRVECNWKSGGKYYSGRVGEKEGSNLFIKYDDGDKEHTTDSMCRPLAAASSGGLGEGSKVECRWKNGSTWYPGVIAERTGKQVFIHYKDGDKENTTLDKCRAAGGSSATTEAGELGVGSAVSCKWKNGGTWYPGVIAEKTGSKVFINYNDGDKEHTTLSKCRAR